MYEYCNCIVSSYLAWKPTSFHLLPPLFFFSISVLAAPLAITALKALGRNPDVSRKFVTQDNLSLLMAVSRYYEGEDMDASNEALKIVANALLLVELGRTTWVTTDVGGGDWCIDVMEVG
jgi:hypothetical protein